MRDIVDLMQSDAGRSLLASRRIFVDPEAFAAALKAPRQFSLCAGVAQKPVYVGQQIYVDYSASVVHKFAALANLAAEPDIVPMAIWMDTDRSGADKQTSKIHWKHQGRIISVRVAPPGYKDSEPRFIPVDPAQLGKAVKQIESAVLMLLAPNGRSAAKAQIRRLTEQFTVGNDHTLRDFNLKITRFLLDDYLDRPFSHCFVSSLIEQSAFQTVIDHCLNQRAAMIKTLNAAISSVAMDGINPIIKPVGEEYLPFYYSCPIDNVRLRLSAKWLGGHWQATGLCKRCGEVYQFPLGAHSLSGKALYVTGRWSPDVLWPVFLAPFISGGIAGKTTAAYGMVLNRVIERVLTIPAPPMLAPAALTRPLAAHQVDSLIYTFLTDTSMQALRETQ